jgi:hypothetical protein
MSQKFPLQNLLVFVQGPVSHDQSLTEFLLVCFAVVGYYRELKAYDD